MGHSLVLVAILLIVAWGVTVEWRIIHVRAKSYLLSATFLMIFWIALRWIKWEFVSDLNYARQIWYLYYLPMLMIPLFFLCIAMVLGKSEDVRHPIPLKIAFWITGFLVFFVLTNDMHRKVFSFPADVQVWSDREYSYETGYFIVVAWLVFCGLFAFCVMIQKARALKNRKILLVPILSIGFLFIYAILYGLQMIPHIYPLYDIALVFCLCFTVVLEGCIQSGLIPSNTHYAELFQLSMIDGQIADSQFHVRLTSRNSEPLPEETVRRMAGIRLEQAEHTRLVSAPLKNGYVLWKEDVSEISEVLAELADKSEYLTARKVALQKEVDTSRKEHLLEEKNRLYNTLMDETAGEIERFSELLDQIEGTEDSEEIQRLTKRLAVICTHIKRRSNLLFLAEQDGGIEPGEMRFAMEECFSNLRMGGVTCGGMFEVRESVELSDMLFLYDVFHKLLLVVLDDLESLFVNFQKKEGRPCLRVTFTCREGVTVEGAMGAEPTDAEIAGAQPVDAQLVGTESTDAGNAGVQLVDAEDGEWIFEITPPVGGGV